MMRRGVGPTGLSRSRIVRIFLGSRSADDAPKDQSERALRSRPCESSPALLVTSCSHKRRGETGRQEDREQADAGCGSSLGNPLDIDG